MHKYIAIEGVIGVGKTTLARLLQPIFDATVLLEVFEENPFLADFYGDRSRYAFQTQIFFLLSRYHQQHQAVPAALNRGALITDYTFAKDELFAWINLKDDELAMYGRVHAALGEKIPKPDLIVYLHAEHDEVMRRIAQRDRPYERDMDPNYIQELAKAYAAWVSTGQETAVLPIDVTTLDFLSKPEDLNTVVQTINDALQSQTHVPSSGSSDQAAMLRNGRLSDYQSFHQYLDDVKSFDPDLFYNFMLLTEELGEVSSEMIKIWRETQRLVGNGRLSQDAHNEAISTHRLTLRSELADLLAYIFKIANYTGIDLEAAYVEKMKQNINREWE